MTPFVQIVQKIDPALTFRRAWNLTGGVSAQVTAMEAELEDGTIQKMVVRQHGEIDLRHNPHIAHDEFRLLGILQRAGIPAPKPYLVDDSCTRLPTPYIVIEFIEGVTHFTLDSIPDGIAHLATHLAAIHQIKLSATNLDFLPTMSGRLSAMLASPPDVLDDSLSEGDVRAALISFGDVIGRNPVGLLHGDYWLGNVLWNDGKVAGILDWEDAAVGDPLADVANARLELLFALGTEAMTEFTEVYQVSAPIDFTDLPYWDLYAALRPAGKLHTWGLDVEVERTMRERHRWFVGRAIQHLNP